MARRRETAKYRENPWIEKAAMEVAKNKGYRILTAKGDEKKFIVGPQTGEIEGFSGFYTKIETDKTHFMKIYAEGIRAFTGLSTAGLKIFLLVYDKITSNDGFNKDTILLNYEMLTDEEKKEFSIRTFQRGITDLIKHEFLAETMQAGVYFINPAYIFNGDRLAIVNEYFYKPMKKVRDTDERPAELGESENPADKDAPVDLPLFD